MVNMAEILIDPSEEREIVDFRVLGFHDVLVLGRYCYTAAHRPLAEHSHGRMLEICYLERGQQTYFVGQERYDLTGGDVFLTFPHEPHGTGRAPESKGVLFWCLIRLPERNQRLLGLDRSESRQLISKLLGLPRHFRLGDLPAADLYRIFAVHRQESLPLRTVELRNLVLRFLLSLVRACPQSERRVSLAIRKVLGIIDSNPRRDFRVGELARLSAMSESRFKERFRAEVGVPPAEYMMRRKINVAKSLLRSGGHTVTGIAMDLGFSSSQYFATVFKRYTGRNPRDYRGIDDSQGERHGQREDAAGNQPDRL